MIPYTLNYKQKIKGQFSSAAGNYDRTAHLQKKVAEELLEHILLNTQHSTLNTILDAGCGTGFLTIPLAKAFPDAKISGCDMAHPMVKTLQLKIKNSKPKTLNLKPLTADCESLPYKNCLFDMVASNLTYQWLQCLDAAFKEAYRVLKPDGMFVFSTLGQETLKELRECYKEANLISNKDGLPPFMRFLDGDKIFLKLRQTGFSYIFTRTDLKIEPYQNLMEFLRILKAIGAGNPFDGGEKNLGRGMILKRVAEVYEKRFNIQNSIYATYEVMFFTAWK